MVKLTPEQQEEMVKDITRKLNKVLEGFPLRSREEIDRYIKWVNSWSCYKTENRHLERKINI